MAATPELYFRYGPMSGKWSNWQPSNRPARAWYALLLNSNENLYLAGNTLVEKFSVELQNRAPSEDLISFQLVHRWVIWQLRDSLKAGHVCQFKIKLMSGNGEGEDLFTSKILPVTASLLTIQRQAEADKKPRSNRD